MTKIAEDADLHVLFLPPYSPDFNPTEQAFVILKKNRIHQDVELTIDDIIKSYGLFLE